MKKKIFEFLSKLPDLVRNTKLAVESVQNCRNQMGIVWFIKNGRKIVDKTVEALGLILSL